MRLIDADALKRAACVKFYTTPYYKHILDLIDNAPTVDTSFREVVAYECGQKSVEERPKGKWEYTTHYGRRYRICPVCGMEREDDRVRAGITVLTVGQEWRVTYEQNR